MILSRRLLNVEEEGEIEAELCLSEDKDQAANETNKMNTINYKLILFAKLCQSMQRYARIYRFIIFILTGMQSE